jgi:hypothetical protein
MGWKCSWDGEAKMYIKNFDGKVLGRELRGRVRRKHENTIKINLKKIDSEGWT